MTSAIQVPSLSGHTVPCWLRLNSAKFVKDGYQSIFVRNLVHEKSTFLCDLCKPNTRTTTSGLLSLSS